VITHAVGADRYQQRVGPCSDRVRGCSLVDGRTLNLIEKSMRGE
jgi:hypothetical protein